MLYMSLCKGGGDMLYMSLRKGGGRYAIHVFT